MSISQEINWDIAKNIAPRLNQSKLQSQQGKHSLQPVSGIQDVLLGFCRRLWPCGLQHAWVFSHADSSLFLFRRCPTPLTSWASSCVYCSLVPTLQTVHTGLPGQLWHLPHMGWSHSLSSRTLVQVFRRTSSVVSCARCHVDKTSLRCPQALLDSAAERKKISP